MLVKFSSISGQSLSMFENQAKKMLRAMDMTGNIPGAINAEDLQAALDHLEKSIEKEVRKIAAVTVKNAMTSDPVTVGPEAGIEDIASLMIKHDIHTLPVLDQGTLVGIIGKEDILRTLVPSGEND